MLIYKLPRNVGYELPTFLVIPRQHGSFDYMPRATEKSLTQHLKTSAGEDIKVSIVTTIESDPSVATSCKVGTGLLAANGQPGG